MYTMVLTLSKNLESRKKVMIMRRTTRLVRKPLNL